MGTSDSPDSTVPTGRDRSSGHLMSHCCWGEDRPPDTVSVPSSAWPWTSEWPSVPSIRAHCRHLSQLFGQFKPVRRGVKLCSLGEVQIVAEIFKTGLPSCPATTYQCLISDLLHKCRCSIFHLDVISLLRSCFICQ